MEKHLMRIGEFASKFDIKTNTIRYYVNKGILVPLNRNERYLFSEDDCEDLRFLLELKKMHFSLEDIHKILSLKRLSNLANEDERNDYINIFRNQYASICEKANELKYVKRQLLNEIKNTTDRANIRNSVLSGVPLFALSLLACPNCGASLVLSNATISNDNITKGKLSCTCGYVAKIRDGIIIGDQGHVSIYDGPDTNRACYRGMSPDLVTLIRKDYIWLLNKMESIQGFNVVLEDYINDYCFTHANIETLDEKNLYIITDKFPEVVEMYKRLIEQKNLPHKVLYISAASYLLPLKNDCIDVYLDFASNECAIFDENFSFDFLSRYFKPGSIALGGFWHFNSNAGSLQELKRQYPETWDKNFDIKYFLSYLQSKYEKIDDYKLLGSIDDSGVDESFSYHQPGDILSLTTYKASGYKK